jgi:RNA ligase (TIGR02306 family)
VKLWSKLKNFVAGFARTATTTSTSTDTEFTAEVVRITQVLPHPNADRLEILRFEMKGIGETAYEVVSQKGQFSVGDLATYFSVDCLLPTSHPDFAFLKGRMDGAGKEIFRLRAARLRGVFSQGLLVPCPRGLDFGAAAAEHFGVTYYRAPEPEGMGGGAVPSKRPIPQPFPVYGVDSLKKCPRLFEEGEPVVVTEKIHGTNFRFGWVRRRFLGIPCGWKFVVGSHRVIKGDRQKGFYGEDVWQDAAEKMDLARKTRDYKGYTFYGELYGYTYSGKKIQDLTYGRKPEDGPGLACFDIRKPNGEWMTADERTWALADCELPWPPAIAWRETFCSTWAKNIAEGTSYLAPDQIREGVVIESVQGPRRKAKYVGEGYLTRKEVQ